MAGEKTIMEWKIILFLLALAFILALIVVWQRKRNKVLQEKLEELAFKKQSLSSKYGKMTEQFLPFLEEYPYDPQNFRFIGSPIDGIQFEEDKIVLVEFKAANSKLTEKQGKIKDLAENKKVEFKEYRI